MADFLLELLTEEIPARMQAKAAEDLGRLFAEALGAAGLAAAIETHVTPRRLTLFARGLPTETTPTREERRGPRADAPAQAIEGFLRATGLPRAALEERDDPKGRFLYAVIETPGRPTIDVLPGAVAQAVGALPWPKSMRWGEASISMDSPRWVRPLTSVIALLDDDIVPLEVLGVPSGRLTRGHRFMGPREPVAIESPATYAAQLRAAHVILDAAERRRIIAEGARAAAAQAGLALIEDAGLVAENAGLTEWPVPLLGRFDPAFLEVPREVIQLTMRTNQKYFACTDATGALAPAFVCVANIEAADGGAVIVEGNRRVLAARLSDARFFWEQDKAKPLETYLPKLQQVVFHEHLGSMRDKAERVAHLARWLAESGAVPGAEPALAERAGLLCKADLVTSAVGEFPELQGVMGGYYGAAAGEAPQVAAAIRDHYKPQGPTDTVPAEPVSVAVALADKLDTLFRFFAIGERPTGSRDPFALRRAALGILRLMRENRLNFRLRHALRGDDPNLSGAQSGVIGDVCHFIEERLIVMLRDEGISADISIAARAAEKDEGGKPLRLEARVRALAALLATDDGRNLLAAYRRAANILGIEAKKDGPFEGGDEAAAATPADAALRTALDAALPAATAAIDAEDFEGAMAALATLRAPIDAFFAGVMVNDPVPEIRRARLALLARFVTTANAVADFSKIEG